ncbi:transcriptional regulator [Lactobacillus rhamnosus GG] [Lacticaseibacillus rhamnosus]|nr:transcriptional regulator [Lactobacillus rhamnosus GG] [Lacticaseibacillus rhamnosus]
MVKAASLHGLCVFLAAVLFSLAWQNLFAMAFGLQLVYMATAMTLLPVSYTHLRAHET